MQLPDFLETDSKGGIHLRGHRVWLDHLVPLYNQGWTAEAIATRFPSVELALIYKTIAYYLDNRQSLDVYLEKAAAELQQQRAAPSGGPALEELRSRLRVKQASTLGA